MAVRASQFFKRYLSDSIAFFMMAQILLVVATGAIAWTIWNQTRIDGFSAFVLSLGVLLIIQVVLAPFVLSALSKPLKIISQAIAHVSKDPVQTPPPDITPRRYELNGVKAMVQTIYELAVSSQSPAGTAAAANDTPLERYKILLENAPVGIVAFNRQGEIIIANALAPVRETSNGGRELELLFEQTNSFTTWFGDAAATKVRDTKTWHWIPNALPDTEDRRIFDVVGYYNKAGEQSVEAILITIDRTAEYSPTEEGMDFIALAAHELRGPITVIRGYLDLVGDELGAQLTAEQKELIDRLEVSAEQLSGYVNNILNVSRYDRNHLKLHLHEEHLYDIVKELIPGLALRAKTKKRRLTLRVPENLPTIAADPSSLSEVINNLIDNAIKYSKENGEVIVSAQPKDNFVEVTVQDSGIGIPASVVGNLFTKFYRSHRSRQQVGGTGLGLYICKAIVESHGGTIWVRSKEGEGSTFGFTIPIYSTVADKLARDNNGNAQIIERSDGWIKNHAMYRR